MLFSVIVPVYNVEEYLTTCIESVLGQNDNDFELLLIDDGSTDSSGSICDEYSLKYPNIIRAFHKQNEGLLLTRRYGIQRAKGEWFVHLDSDDYMFPGSLLKIRKAIEESNADLILYKIVYGNSDPNDFSVMSKLPYENGKIFEGEDLYTIRTQLIRGGYLTAIYQKAAKREIVDIDVDYHQWNGVSLREDYLQSLALFDKCKRAAFLDTAVVYYRWNENSITKQKSYGAYEAMLRSSMIVSEETKKYWKKWNTTDEDLRGIAVKELRMIVRLLTDCCSTVNSKEERNKLKKLVQDTVGYDVFKALYTNTTPREVGFYSYIVLRMAIAKRTWLLRTICVLFQKIIRPKQA